VSRKRPRVWNRETVRAELLARLAIYRVKQVSTETLYERLSGVTFALLESVLVELRNEGLARSGDAGWYLVEPAPAFGSIPAGGGAHAEAAGARSAAAESAWRGAVAA
jgi:hypothetical protein